MLKFMNTFYRFGVSFGYLLFKKRLEIIYHKVGKFVNKNNTKIFNVILTAVSIRTKGLKVLMVTLPK